MSGRGRLLLAAGAVAAFVLIGAWWFARSGATQDPGYPAANAAATPPAASAPTGPPSHAGQSAGAPPAAVGAREPGAPLPRAIAPEGNAEEQAAQLVDRLRRGGDDAVVALVTAIDLAGFPIRNADGSVIAPSGTSHGIAFSAWEVNALANFVATRQMVTAPLASVADALSAGWPELTAEQVTTYLLDGVRRHAHATSGPLVFWSAFVIELGRRAQTHEQYDLLGNVDPKTARLDLLQLAFLTRRLAADVAVFAHPERARSRPAPVPGARFLDLIAPPVFAQASPCQFTDTETEILDWTAIGSNQAFGMLIEYLEGQDMKGAEKTGRAVALLGVALAYLKVALTQWALDIDFELQNAPLVRTTALRPKGGERRTLTTKVSLNFGKLAWINCFRIMLNGMGLDLNVDRDGPLKGAEVTWTGWAGFRAPWAIGAGPEHLVQFVGDESNRIQGSGPTARSHANMNRITDANGAARVDITGLGQEEALGSQPREVMKEATLSAAIVLKPNDLFRDLKEAGVTAMGGLAALAGLPAELLFRTRWAFGASHTFPVKDWKVGNGWSGTISYREIEHRFWENIRESHCCGGRPTTHESRDESEEIREAHWELPSHTGTDPLTSDFSMGTARMTVTVSRTERSRSHSNSYASCRGGSHPMTTTTNERQLDGHADYSGPAQVTVTLDKEGEFAIEAGMPESEALGERTSVVTMKRNDGCTGDLPPRVDTNTGKWRAGGVSAGIQGTADPDADALQGTRTKVTKSRDGRIVRTQIYEWDLRR